MPSNEGVRSGLGKETQRVLVIGGSYGGLVAIVSLLDICSGRRCRFADDAEADNTPQVNIQLEITLVDERDGYYHLIGSPLAFADPDYSSKAWKKFHDVPAIQHDWIRIVQGTAETVDPLKKAATIKLHESGQRNTIQYDYLIVASGLQRTYPSVPQSLTKQSYLTETRKHIKSVSDTERGVAVIGGGAVGIEMAAELKVTTPAQKVALIHSRNQLLSSEDLPDEFKDLALEALEDLGVEVILNDRVTDIIDQKDDEEGKSYFKLTLKDSKHLEAGHVINAVSKFHPTSSYLPSSTIDDKGYVKIKPSLSFPEGTPNDIYHYAVGDIAKWSGIKRCGSAMHQGHYAAVNLYLHILQEKFGYKVALLELGDVPPMMGLAVGKRAVTYVPSEGVISSEEQMKLYFGNDLAYDSMDPYFYSRLHPLDLFSVLADYAPDCWNYMQLGKSAI